MDQGDLGFGVSGDELCRQRGQREDQKQKGKQHRTGHGEHQVNERCALCVPAGPGGGQHRSDTGAYVLAEQHKHRAVQPQHAPRRQGLQNAHRRGGGLNNSGKQRAGQDTQQGVGEGGHQIQKGRLLPQGGHRRAHHVHADKQHAQTGHDLTDVLELRVFDEHQGGHAQESEHRGHRAHIQGNEQAGDGRTDVCAHDDPHRLAESHHSGADKAHHHHRRGGGGLNDSGDARAHQHA